MSTIILLITWETLENPVLYLRSLKCFTKYLERHGWNLTDNDIGRNWYLEKPYIDETAALQKSNVDQCYEMAVKECGKNLLDFFPVKYELYLDH